MDNRCSDYIYIYISYPIPAVCVSVFCFFHCNGYSLFTLIRVISNSFQGRNIVHLQKYQRVAADELRTVFRELIALNIFIRLLRKMKMR